jgi:L-fucono-1,5-lactonase
MSSGNSRNVRYESTIPIVDAHQHFWDPGRFSYFWMSSAVQPLVRPFLPEDLRPTLSDDGINGTIVVQAISSLEEGRWLLELASANDFIKGVVAWAGLTNPQLGRDLDELQSHPKFRGIRHQIEEEADEAWMVREDVLRGFAEVERRHIPFDLLVKPRHLKHIPVVRDRCPRLKLVVDHIAKPRISEGRFDEWAQELEKVSGLPDVWCKLSGLNTEANWNSWTPDDLRPYVHHIVEVFGYDRVMFGSDWPVCTLAGTYHQVVDALHHALGPLSEPEARKVWYGNASEFYRLG